MIFVITLENVVSMIAASVVALVLLCFWVPIWWRQTRCKHDHGVNETQACDAICRGCGKNLGFIGSWQEKKEKQKKERA